VSKSAAVLVFLATVICTSLAQQQAPQVKVNYLNVCAPAAEDRKALSEALKSVPRTVFATDFEIARGVTSAPGTPTSRWVRIRREFPAKSAFENVQYTFGVDQTGMTEVLVFRIREPKRGQTLQVSLQTTVSSGTPEAMLNTSTPPDRIRVERFGAGSLALARCSEADQRDYEALFAQGAELMTAYRTALKVRETAAAELRKLPSAR